MLVLKLAIISITGVAPGRADIYATRVCLNAGRFMRNAIPWIMAGETRDF